MAVARKFSAVFLVLALVFGGIAVGVVPPPASGVVGRYTDVSVRGGNIESATWSFNPYNKTWHFEITAGASAYQMVVTFPKQRVKGADGAYDVDRYTLTVDLSGLYYALPMQRDPSRTVYRYAYVDCGRYDLPYVALQDLLSKVISVITLDPTWFVTSGTVTDYLTSARIREAFLEAYDECRATVESTVASMRGKDVEGIVLLSTDRVTQSVEVFGVKIYSVELEAPHYYGIIKYAVDTWTPKTAGSMYPVGNVKVNISGRNGTASATIVLQDTSVPAGADRVTASARLPVGNGYIRYVGYVRSTGDVYHLPDPWVLNYDGRYVTVSSSRLMDYYSVARRIDSYLAYGAAKDYVVESRQSFDRLLSRVGSRGLGAYADESRRVRDELRRLVDTAKNTLDDAVRTSPWSEHVVESDVASYGLLKLKPPSSRAPAFKLLLAGDIDAEWIGLRPVPARGKIVDFPRQKVTISRDGGVSFTFAVQNVGDVDGAFDWAVTCSGYGTLASGTTSVVRAGSTVTVPVHGYISGVRDLSKEQTVKCTIFLKNLFGQQMDSATVYLFYRPDVVCQYGVPTCGVKDGVSGYYYCVSPYRPAEFKPCPEGYVCEMTPEGAKCVKQEDGEARDGGEDSLGGRNSFCRGNEICTVEDGRTTCRPCPEGQSCRYVRGEGARCVGGDGDGGGPPSPDRGIRIAPEGGFAELWRVGAAVAALGSLLVWVVVA